MENMIVELSTESIVTQQEIQTRLESLILDGKIQPAIAGVVFRRLEKAMEEFRKNPKVKEMIIDDTKKYLPQGKGKAPIFGANVQVSTVYTKWDYSTCNHPAYEGWLAILKLAKEEMEKIEVELQELYKANEAAKGKGKLGLSEITKDVIIPSIPIITYNKDNGDLDMIALVGSGEVVTLRPPTKYTTEGLKYFDL